MKKIYQSNYMDNSDESDEFINVTNILTQNLDTHDEQIIFDEYDKITQSPPSSHPPIYQTQAHDNYAYLMHIGYANQKQSVLIDEFAYQDMTCKIYSVIENYIPLDNHLNMIKFQIYNTSEHNKLLYLLTFGFTIIPITPTTPITPSTKTNIVKLPGFFTYNFYYEANGILQKVLLKNLKTFPGNKSMIHMGIGFLYSNTVLDLIKLNSIS